MVDKPYVFVSYARSDFEPVHQIVRELQTLGISTWTDIDNLSPGENWMNAIGQAIRQTDAVLIFISPESAGRAWIMHEFELAIDRGIGIIPILLRPTPASQVSPHLAAIQWLDITRYPPATAAKQAAVEISRVLSRIKSKTPAGALPDRQRENLAAALAAQARDQTEAPKERREKSPDSIFIVHGHDEDFLRDVEDFLVQSGIKPIIMKDVGGASASLIQKFFEIGRAADFAVVLLSGDDMGASRIQYEMAGVGMHALKYRTRQNVLLELGFFYGLLGWENVFVLEKGPPKPYPDFERPSDLNGVLWDRYDRNGRWRQELNRRLAALGFQLPAAASQETAG
jgi:predicted nucleotide-binding protein